MYVYVGLVYRPENVNILPKLCHYLNDWRIILLHRFVPMHTFDVMWMIWMITKDTNHITGLPTRWNKLFFFVIVIVFFFRRRVNMCPFFKLYLKYNSILFHYLFKRANSVAGWLVHNQEKSRNFPGKCEKNRNFLGKL